MLAASACERQGLTCDEAAKEAIAIRERAAPCLSDDECVVPGIACPSHEGRCDPCTRETARTLEELGQSFSLSCIPDYAARLGAVCARCPSRDTSYQLACIDGRCGWAPLP